MSKYDIVIIIVCFVIVLIPLMIGIGTLIANIIGDIFTR